MRYRNVDLNLFALFEALLKHRTVSAAARELGITPSAASHGLARLRKVLGDELFTHGPGGMQPTAAAMNLAPQVAEGLDRLAMALTARPFDPAETLRTVVVAASDYFTTLLLPPLARHLARNAPGVHIKIFPPGRPDILEQLDDGHIDAASGWFGMLPQRIIRQTLLSEKEAVVVRAGHPLLQGLLTKERILSYPHVVVELTGSGHRPQDGYIEERGAFRRTWIERIIMEDPAGNDAFGRVAVTVPRYDDVPSLLEGSDMVATLPERLALRAVRRDGVAMLSLPYEPLTVLNELIWHERAAADPGLRWFLDQITVVLQSIDKT
jgi:DNA-binding transcriptional LysR family regulator